MSTEYRVVKKENEMAMRTKGFVPVTNEKEIRENFTPTFRKAVLNKDRPDAAMKRVVADPKPEPKATEKKTVKRGG